MRMISLKIATGILYYIIDAINLLYKTLIQYFWYNTISYGLSPSNAFLIPDLKNQSFLNLYNMLFKTAFLPISAVAIIASSLAVLFYNSFYKPLNPGYNLMKLVAAISIAALSLMIVESVLMELQQGFDYLFKNIGVNWYSFYNFSGGFSKFSVSHPIGSANQEILQFLVLSAYFIAVISLFGVLMMRQALMILMILILPFTTILFSLNIGKKYAKIVWEFIAEMMVYPFLVLLSLYMAYIFSSNIPLQLAFLFVPIVVPTILFFSGRGLTSLPLLSFVGGLTMGTVVSRGIGLTSGLGGAVLSDSIGGSVKNIALSPLQDRIPQKTANMKRSPDSSLPWKQILDEEMKYRKPDSE